MAKLVFTDCRLFAAGADLSGSSNQVEFEAMVGDEDVTNFRSGGAKERLGSLLDGKMSGSGQWEAGDPSLVDDNQWAQLSSRAANAWTICPTDSIVGALAWVTATLETQYALLDKVGGVAPWKGNGPTSGPLARGVILHPPGTARTATGNGTAVEYVAASSTQSVYANLHVLSVSGTTPSLTVAIQSDSAAGFASPATVLTFDAATAIGAQRKIALGPVTDTFYRVSYTISGTTPSFLFAVSLGIA